MVLPSFVWLTTWVLLLAAGLGSQEQWVAGGILDSRAPSPCDFTSLPSACYTNNSPCSAQARIASYSFMRECFARVRADPALQNDTIRVLLTGLEFYSYKDLNKNSTNNNYRPATGRDGGQLQVHPLNIDLEAELKKRMGNSTYLSLADFHLDISDLFNQARDAHCESLLSPR
jgi:hypothetical protein